MSKITLTDLVNLQNEVSAVGTVNANNEALEAAFDNTLSRDGSGPNHMLDELDMNSNRIINLPAAASPTEPVRKQEFDNATFAALGLTPDDKGIVVFDGANASVREIDGNFGIEILNADGSLGNPTIILDNATRASLSKADTATQPGDLGALAAKDQVDISDVNASGTSDNTTYLRGDGMWSVPVGTGGDMVASVYDPAGTHADVFGGTVPAETVSDADVLVLSSAPAAIQTRFFDTDKDPGSEVDFTYSGTSDPLSPGQIDVDVGGVTTFYTRSNLVLRPEQFGCKTGGNATANRAGLMLMFEAADKLGREIDMGSRFETYEVDGDLDYSWTNSPVIKGAGATIKFNPSAPTPFGVKFSLQDLGGHFEGFSVDGNAKVANCLWIDNPASVWDESKIHDLALIGVKTYRGYRYTSGITGGSGIYARGAFRQIFSRECAAVDMKMATGAGVSGSVGILGMYFGRGGSGLGALTTNVIDPYISDIYSEDVSNLVDMDGLMLFDGSTSGECSVRGGYFKNCWGRGVKVQALNAKVSDAQFVTKTAPTGNHTIACVDFQYGSGSAENCHLRYDGAIPQYMIAGTATSGDGFAGSGMLVQGCTVRGSTPLNMTAFAFRYSSASHAVGSAIVQNCSVFAMMDDALASFHTRVVGEIFNVTNNLVRSFGASAVGVRLAGVSPGACTTVFKGNGNIGGSARAMTGVTTVTNTLIGAAADNRYFT